MDFLQLKINDTCVLELKGKPDALGSPKVRERFVEVSFEPLQELTNGSSDTWSASMPTR